MIVSVASGKGGTGKTTIATNLALAMERDCEVQFFDCDVEAPNAHLFLKPQLTYYEPIVAACPTVDSTRCTFCGTCADICAFKALAIVKDRVLVFPDLCHDCGGCELFCPEHAIGRKEHKIGLLECGHAGNIAFNVKENSLRMKVSRRRLFIALKTKGARRCVRYRRRAAGYIVSCRRRNRGK